jgi:hypothetical protein
MKLPHDVRDSHVCCCPEKTLSANANRINPFPIKNAYAADEIDGSNLHPSAVLLSRYHHESPLQFATLSWWHGGGNSLPAIVPILT